MLCDGIHASRKAQHTRTLLGEAVRKYVRARKLYKSRGACFAAYGNDGR